MRRIAIGIAAGALLALAGHGTAAAAEVDGPCATQRALFEKYNIELGMHFPLLEDAYGEVCRRTG